MRSMASSGNLAPLDLSRFIARSPAIETERLRLREITMEDKHAVFDYASDPIVGEFMLHRLPEDERLRLEEHIAELERAKADRDTVSQRGAACLFGGRGA